jgi:phosphoribosylformylglycinamidine synthase subunit PurS
VRARVLVRPKAGILDPQGKVVERALPALGFEGVSNVQVGRLIELDVEDPTRLPEMCERLLTNPLIEDYEVVTEPGAEPAASVAAAGRSPRGGAAEGTRPGHVAP